VGTPVLAAGAGTIFFTGDDDASSSEQESSVLIALDMPLVCQKREYMFTTYRNLSRVRFHAPADGSPIGPHVQQGTLIGWSGEAHRVPYLRFGISVDPDERVRLDAFNIAAYFGWMTGGGGH